MVDNFLREGARILSGGGARARSCEQGGKCTSNQGVSFEHRLEIADDNVRTLELADDSANNIRPKWAVVFSSKCSVFKPLGVIPDIVRILVSGI